MDNMDYTFRPESEKTTKKLNPAELEASRGQYASLMSVLGQMVETLRQQEPEEGDKTKSGAIINIDALTQSIAMLEQTLSGAEDASRALLNLRAAIEGPSYSSGGIPHSVFAMQGPDGARHKEKIIANLTTLVANLEQLSKEINTLEMILGDKPNIKHELQMLQSAVQAKIELYKTKTLPGLASAEVGK